jgi:hypothetical protein
MIDFSRQHPLKRKPPERNSINFRTNLVSYWNIMAYSRDFRVVEHFKDNLQFEKGAKGNEPIKNYKTAHKPKKDSPGTGSRPCYIRF